MRLPVLYGAAGYNNYPALVRRLLAAGAKPDDGESIFHAAENNHPECLAALVAAGGDISGRDPKWKNTPLYFLFGWSPGAARAAAARAGIVWLLDHGADPNVGTYDHRETPIFQAVRNGWDLDIIRQLLERGADPSTRRADGRSILRIAVAAGREDVAKLLGERGAIDDATAAERLLGALGSGDVGRARSLMEGNESWSESLAADVRDLLVGAARRGAVAPFQAAAAVGFNVDLPAEKGETPLHWASWHGHAGIVSLLAGMGADLNRREQSFHAPPLGWCVHGSLNCQARTGDYPATAERLLAGGAEPLSPDIGAGSPEVIAVLRRHWKAKT